MPKPSVYDILNKKRRGEALTDFEITAVVTGFTWGGIPDYQMSALLMAIAIQGMTTREQAALMRAMLESGERWNLRARFDFLADKHSTGGVGDKVSLALAPWVASCGIHIAMLSGRGLGHTGGTLDKLESIPGFNAHLTRDEIERCLADVGCAITTSTEGIAPADRKLYALRDVTGTVESIPLITASIMSKKLALGPSALILDVKCGAGAFMKSEDEALELARSLLSAARGTGTTAEALVTRIDAPLGRAVGNANEVIEAMDILRGDGPEDVTTLVLALATRILVMSGRFDESSARTTLEEAVRSGRAIEHARRWIEAQGGDAEVVDHPKRLPSPSRTLEVKAARSGYVHAIDPYGVGMLAIRLGAGREKKEDSIDYAAGILFERVTGDRVAAGDTLARVQIGSREVEEADELSAKLADLIRIDNLAPERRPLIVEHLTGTPSEGRRSNEGQPGHRPRL
ncbi:MAG TPA: thymidine phosphorylase [Thermoanaerobaculia bacterium]|nr:thymidine phosphorylase [Thermoanaerobaculia bacterium]